MKTKVLTIALCLIISWGYAQDQPPTVAFLGTFHFAGSSDLLAMKVEDMSGEKRQQEIEEMVDLLALYKPTKIILEYPYGKTKLDSLYKAYLKGNHKLSINERQQVGFRLAKKLGHPGIYAGDHYVDLPFNELMQFLEAEGRMGEFQALIDQMKVEVIDEHQKYYDSHTIKEFFVFLNSDEMDRENIASYLEYFSKYVSDENDVGIRLVAKWWERNFRIMSNIDRISEPGDRILVFFGQGHTSLLKGFYQKRSDIAYEEITEYLK